MGQNPSWEANESFQGLCVLFVTCEELLAPRPTPLPPPPPSWRITPCLLSATASSVYSQLPSTSAGRSSNRSLRTRHAAVTGTDLSRKWNTVEPLITDTVINEHLQ
jgi:hypothetical protein